MPVTINSSFLYPPTDSEAGILGIRVIGTDPISRPIHIALVLDTSGSMEGSRIIAVKNTLSVLINRLTIGDKITVIGFSSTATLLLSNFTITETNRSDALKIISELEADGGTNIESGIAQLGSHFTNGSVLPDSIVLLTDGYINEGISSVAGVYSLLGSYVPAVPVYCLGYGDDHNADFMKGISMRTNGTYTFIDDEIALPASIGDLLGGLQSEVGKNAELLFPADWTCLELNYISGNYGIGSIIADKPTWAMFSAPASAVGNIKLTYKDSNFITHTISPSNDTLERIEICEQYMRCLCAVSLDKASNFIKAGNLTAANLEITVMIDKISKSEAVNRPLAIRMKAQLAEMIDMIDNALRTPPRLHRQNNFANLLLRTGSTATQYGQQRGVSSNGHGDLFSTPRIAERTSQMVDQYSANHEDPYNVMT